MDTRSLLPFGFGRSREVALGAERDPFRAFRREMERMFDDVYRGWPFGALAEGEERLVSPRIDVSETDGELLVTAELPGMEEKDIDVTLAGNMLIVRGEKKSESERKAEDYHVMERSFGRFSRTIPVPFEADPDQVKASFKQGVLTVKIPKPAEIKEKSKKIAIEHAA
jgi:HSP20 family protein